MPRIREGFTGQTMIVLPRPLVRDALAGELPIPLVPSDAGYFPTAASHFVERPAGSPQAILMYCVGGKGWLRFENAEYVVGTGQIAIVLPGQPHSYGSSEEAPWSIYWCHAAGTAAERIAALTVTRNASAVANVSDHARLAGLFREIIDELEHGYGPPHLLAASLALGHLLGCVYAENGQPESVPSAAMRTRRVAAYLRELPQGPVRLSELARMANLSISHFSAIFRREFGFSPLNYLLRARMLRACELLDTTGGSVKQISGAVGFADPLYFSRMFRCIYGVSPMQHRSVAKG